MKTLDRYSYVCPHCKCRVKRPTARGYRQKIYCGGEKVGSCRIRNICVACGRTLSKKQSRIYRNIPSWLIFDEDDDDEIIV